MYQLSEWSSSERNRRTIDEGRKKRKESNAYTLGVFRPRFSLTFELAIK